MRALRGQTAKQDTCANTRVTQNDRGGPEESGNEPQGFSVFSLEKL